MASTPGSLGEQLIHCAVCDRRTFHSIAEPPRCRLCGTAIIFPSASGPYQSPAGEAAGREPAGAGEDGRRHLLPLGRPATVAELLQCASEDAELVVAELQEAPEPDEEDLVRIVGRAEQLALGLRCALRVLRGRLRAEALEAITREVMP